MWSLFRRRPVLIQSVAIRAGDDVVVRHADRLDSDDALALLKALREQFPKLTIHLLTGFVGLEVKRGDGGSQAGSCDAGGDPPLPVSHPTKVNPLFEAAKASEKGDIVAITYASGLHLVAVSIPPKE